MKINIEKNVDVKALINKYIQMFSSSDYEWEFNSEDWETITNTLTVLTAYYEKYGDID